MTVRYRLIFLLLSLIILLVTGYYATGSFQFIGKDYWFYAGLLLLILLSVIDQPFFSKDANIFLNATAGFISLLSVSEASRKNLWYAFLILTIYLIATSYYLMIYRSKNLSNENKFIVLLSRVNREVGKPEALFSAFFLWGIFQQFSPDSNAYRWLLLFWGCFLITNTPSIANAIASFFAPATGESQEYIGTIITYSSPHIAECLLQQSCPQLLQGSLLSIHSKNGTMIAKGKVIDDRILNKKRMARLVIVQTYQDWQKFSEPATEKSATLKILNNSPDTYEGMAVGVVGIGSNIGTLRLLVNPGIDLVEGEVLAVDLNPAHRAYYQIVGATLCQRKVDDNQAIQDIDVVASQLGIWNDNSSRFEPVSWVAPAGALVFRAANPTEEKHRIPSGNLFLGHVPNSQFPVHACLDDIVTHNTALIGVTGSGKSYLSFWIIEGLIKNSIRVLVLDISRQYWVFLGKHNPYPIRDESDIQKWLDSDKLIAIHQYASSTSYPGTTATLAQNVFKYLEGKTSLRPGSNEPAKICIVLEEAHSLIPEWNQVAQQADHNLVNKTARTILQGRKYGLGCIVISQRTANITKTILNQCNTIIALQSFDQTGLDFLSNYMGSSYANTISTLPSHHAVIVGKASSSTRPILFQIKDLSKNWLSEDEVC